VKTLYSAEIEQKTYLEQLLRKCVDDVKNEITKKRSENKVMYYTTKSRSSTAKGGRRRVGEEEEDLTVQERDKIIEVLLSQERVLTLLYDKTFPPKVGAVIKTKVGKSSKKQSSKLMRDLEEVLDEENLRK